MILVDDVMISMRARVMITPVIPAKYVKATYKPPTGFCEVIAHVGQRGCIKAKAAEPSVYLTCQILHPIANP